MTVVALGCGPSGDAGRDDQTAGPAGGELVVGATQDEFGMVLNRQRLGMYPLNAGICESLLRLTPDFRAEPWLAKRWEYRGGNTYRFVLRTGVRFHDGRPLTAEAVKYSLDRAAPQIQHSFLTPESVRIVDDTIVDVTPARPNLRLPEQLVHPSWSILAPGSDPSERPVCTGAFRFLEYVPGDHLTVARNDQYWGEPARLARITFRFIPDDNTRVLALRSGDVHAIFDVHRSSVSSLVEVPGVHVAEAPPGAVMMMYMRLRGGDPPVPLADPGVRRAIALALDRRVLVERVLEGHAAVVQTVNPPAVLEPFADRVEGLPYDPVRAGELLEEVGWVAGSDGIRRREGRTLALTLIRQPTAIDPAVAEYVQAQLAAVGIELTIESLEQGAFVSRLNAGRFDLDIELPNQNDANPAFLLALRWYPPANVHSARYMAPGPHYDSLVERALSAVDPVAARRDASEAMHVLLDREVAAIPLAGINRLYALHERVRGFEPHPSKTNQSWAGVWLSR